MKFKTFTFFAAPLLLAALVGVVGVLQCGDAEKKEKKKNISQMNKKKRLALLCKNNQDRSISW
jgi:hypothetical protein